MDWKRKQYVVGLGRPGERRGTLDRLFGREHRFPASGPDQDWWAAFGADVLEILPAPTYDARTHKLALIETPAPSNGAVQLYEAVSLDAGEIAAALTLRQASMWEQAKVRREEIIYSPIGEIDLRGDGLLRVEPDIRNQGDRDNLTGLHTFAVALAAKGETNAVIAFGDASNDEVMLTPAEMIALAQAVFIRGSLAYQRSRQLRQAIYAKNADSVSLNLIDIDAGSIDGVGSWSNPVE